MTPTASLLAFGAAAALLTVTPGLDTALVLRTAIGESRRAALAAALGVCCGCLAWAVLVALGVAALLAASETAYALLRAVGACWLVWLGLRLLWRSRRPPAAALLPRDGPDGPEARPARAGSAFVRGLLTNLLNPKVGVFYVTFLPPFVPAGVEAGAWMIGLGAIHAALGLCWFALLVRVAHAARAALTRPAVVQWIDRVAAVAFIAFGARLMLSQRPA